MCPLASKAEIEIRKQEFPKPVNCRLAVLDVRFGSKADMCAAKRHVCFPPNSDRESEIPQKAVSALPPKADMCGALAYSITSSAAKRMPVGMVKPSAFAGLGLTTNSNFVGCSIGKSAGFAPFRIRAT